MQIRHLRWFGLVTLLACAPAPPAELVSTAQPTDPDALYQHQPLPIGATFTYQVSSGGQTQIRENTVVGVASYAGREVVRFKTAGQDGFTFFDAATNNWVANVDANDKPLFQATPYGAAYKWPLWVGKAWRHSYAYEDKNAGKTWNGIAPSMTVEARETITVPAGTFEALRLQSGPGPQVGFAETLWYAPRLGVAVKIRYVRTDQHYRGAGGERVTVLTAYVVPD